MTRSFTAMPRMPLDWGDDEAATRVRQDSACLSLVAREGPLAGRVFGSDGDPLTIGRGAGCAVRLPLAEISRRHARIRYHAGRFWVEDLRTLNGTWLNQQLIDRPMPLKSGDRIRIGDQEFEVRFELLVSREVVQDSREVVEEEEERAAAALPHAPVSPWPRLLTLALLVVLPVATAMAVIVIRSAQTRKAVVAWAGPAPGGPPAPAVTRAPASAAPAPVAARIDVDGAEVVIAGADGTVQRAVARGSAVRGGDVVVRLRGSKEAKRKELERVNAKLDDDEDNPKLVQRAHELVAELEDEPPVTTLKSARNGVVVDVAAAGARLRTGDAAFRVARALRLTVDPSAIEGSGSACRVRLLDQNLDLEGRRAGAVIEVTRFPAELSLDRIGRVRADCK